MKWSTSRTTDCSRWSEYDYDLLICEKKTCLDCELRYVPNLANIVIKHLLGLICIMKRALEFCTACT